MGDIHESQDRAHHRTAPHGAEVARPERPELSDTTPAPLVNVVERPTAAAWALNAWGLGTLLLTFAAVTLLLTRAGVSGRLAELLRERDPSFDGASLTSGSSKIVIALLVALVLAALLAGLILRGFSRRRQWPRFLMFPVWVLVLVVAGLAAVVSPTDRWQGWLLLGSLTLAVVTVLVGSLAAMGPGVSAWLRAARREHPRDS